MLTIKLREEDMSKAQKGNREAKKPKKEKIKTIAAAPSQKTVEWQPSFGSGKKKCKRVRRGRAAFVSRPAEA